MVDIDTETHTFLFDCKISIDTRSPHPLFKLAKDFEILELTNKLSPVSYVVNGDTIFIQDIDAKTIQFENGKYDIAEPVYPKEFIPFLFSIVGWKDINRLSMLYLIPGSLDCQVIYGELEKISDAGFELTLKELLSDEKININPRDGFPVSFNMLDGNLVVRELKLMR